MTQINSNTITRNETNNLSLSFLSAIFVSIAHLSVGIGIIGLSTFIPGQLAILNKTTGNWPDSLIAILLGIATLFELSRVGIAYLQDRKSIFKSYRRIYVFIGLIVQSTGLLLISQLLGSLLIVIGMIFFTIGSATVSTTIDAYLVDRSDESNRNRYAATLQFFRLSGFAVGGIMGTILYSQLGFKDFFIFLSIFGFVIGLISVLAIRESEDYRALRKEQLSSETVKYDIEVLKKQLKKPIVLGMILFLILYPLGLFLQDAILEPYAVNIFDFNEEGIGRLAAVWGTATLVFIPLGIFFDRRIGRMQTIISGTIIAAFGLWLIAILGLNPLEIKPLDLELYQTSLLLALIVFGIGLGLMTTPSTALMLDVTAISKNKTLILSVFGLAITIGRSGASFIAAIIMTFENYQILFLIESFFLLSSIIPLYFVYKNLKSKNLIKSEEGFEIYASVELN
jgi:BCD family chlorophyll transporter-like MFS transporter